MVNDSWKKFLLLGWCWHISVWNGRCQIFTHPGQACILHASCWECCPPRCSRIWNIDIFWTCKMWLRWTADGCSMNSVSCSTWNLPSLRWLPTVYPAGAFHKLLGIFCIHREKLAECLPKSFPDPEILNLYFCSPKFSVFGHCASEWGPHEPSITSIAKFGQHHFKWNMETQLKYAMSAEVWEGVFLQMLYSVRNYCLSQNLIRLTIYSPELCDLQ